VTAAAIAQPPGALPPLGVHDPLLSPADIADLAARAAAAPLHLPRHEVHDRTAGDWPSPRLGRGLDFEEARPYATGDDVRAMDWRSTARLGHPYVKVYREERQPTWQLVLDRSPTMRFGTRRRLKVTQAARAALWLAFQGAQQQAAVGATLWDTEDISLPARLGRAARDTLIARLNAPCPPQAGGKAGPDDAAAAAAPAAAHAPITETTRLRLLALATRLPRGSRIWLLSDMAWLRALHVDALARLADHAVLHVVRVFDPSERSLPAMGRVRMLDIASGTTRWVETARRTDREAFAVAQARQLDQQNNWLRAAGITALDMDSSRDDVDALLAAHG
jgi:uncharacterized protein (DUF58 family)